MKYRVQCLVAVLIGFNGVVMMAAQSSAPEKGEIKLHFENDVFAGSDRYYTHATRLEYAFPPDNEPQWLGWLTDRIDRQIESYSVALYIAQYMYTASDIEIVEPSPSDRPYGGWLYAGLSLTRIHTEYLADSLSASVGVVGPLSQSEGTQKFVHKLIDSAEPLGWDHQLRNEPTVDIMYERMYRPCGTPDPGLGFDYLPYWGANIGNVFIQGRAGVTFRVGLNLPDDFGPSLLKPTFISTDRVARPLPIKYRWFLFASTEARAVGRNLFLDGNTFRDSPSVDKHPVVGDLVLGVSGVLYDNLTVTYSYVRRTKEFKTQEFSQEFGSMSIAYRF